MEAGMGKSDIPVSYGINGGLTSDKFVKAFAYGCGGTISHNPSMLFPGPVAMFGDPTLYRLLEQARIEGRTWYYGDHAYFRRRVYYRITKNRWQHSTQGDATPARWERLGVRIQPWREGGYKVLLCPQSPRFFELHGMNHIHWIRDTMKELQRHTDRPIEVRYKPGGSQTEEEFRRSLREVHAVVVYTSVAGAQAAIHGVPCFATHECVSKHFGTDDLSRIENPVKPEDRERMAWLLADNQWTMEEIRQGIAWEHVR
jgi:hypothetical protein